MRKINNPAIFHISLISLLLLIFLFPAMVMAEFQPVFKPKLEIAKSNGPIKIDGELNDSGWKNCASTGDFAETYPGDNSAPAVDTKVLVTYDDDNIYIGAICYDNPNEIRATMCQRDLFGSDDAFAIMFDTYQNTVLAYQFFINPYGIQKDFIYTNIMGSNIEYDLIWYSAAQITSEGYQVEIAIPFSSIRFPNTDLQTWGIDFKRIRPRDSQYQYEWAAKDREESCLLCQWGTMTGLGNVHPGKGIEILPSVISTQSGALTNYYADSSFKNDDIKGEFSLGGKYSLSSDITVEAVYNPDFRQVEGDAAQIDVNSTIALFYPEKRPFFQEGIDIFRTLFNSFDTRTVNDPLLAVKLIGRTSKFRFGLLSAIDDNTQSFIPLEEGSTDYFDLKKSYVNVFRGIYSLGQGSQIGYTINDRRYDIGGSNTVIGIDQDIRLSRLFRVDGQYVYSYSNEIDDSTYRFFNDTAKINPEKESYDYALNGESFGDFAFISRLKFSPRNFFAMFDYNQVGEFYQTQTGYDPWVNYRNISIYSQYNYYPKSGIFELITPQIYIGRRVRMDWSPWFENINVSLQTNLKFAQTNFSISYGKDKERWDGIDYNNLWHYNIELGSRFNNRLAYYASLSHGVGVALLAGEYGVEDSYYLSLNFKPIDRLVIEPSLNWFISDHKESGERLLENTVFRSRFQLQITKALSMRFILQYSMRDINADFLDENLDMNHYIDNRKRWDFDPLITYRLNPFTIFYVGSTSDQSSAYYHYSIDSQNEITQEWENIYLDERKRNMSSSSRQYFMKLQYLFQI
ncbi:MAG: sugar-binding protein [Candidatus Zixiibacteriota bacterium]